MTLHEHRRPLVCWRGEFRRKGRIVERMGRLTAARWENDRLGDRDVTVDVRAKVERATQDPVGSLVQVEVDKRGGFRRRPTDEDDPPWSGAELSYVSKFGRNDLTTLGPRINPSQRPDAVADEA